MRNQIQDMKPFSCVIDETVLMTLCKSKIALNDSTKMTKLRDQRSLEDRAEQALSNACS